MDHLPISCNYVKINGLPPVEQVLSQRVQGVKDSGVRVKGRKTTVDYIKMLYITYGSVCELETQILLARNLDFIEKVN